jgi:hypothetical protein
VTPLFNAHPMTSAVQQSPLAHQGGFAHVGAGSSDVYGAQRSFAWGTERGHTPVPESLNALNSGTYRKFDSGPGYQPMEVR